MKHNSPSQSGVVLIALMIFFSLAAVGSLILYLNTKSVEPEEIDNVTEKIVETPSPPEYFTYGGEKYYFVEEHYFEGQNLIVGSNRETLTCHLYIGEMCTLFLKQSGGYKKIDDLGHHSNIEIIDEEMFLVGSFAEGLTSLFELYKYLPDQEKTIDAVTYQISYAD